MANDIACVKETFRIFRRRPFLYCATALTPIVGMFVLAYLSSLAVYQGLARQGNIHGVQQAPSSHPAWLVGCVVLFLLLETAAVAAGTSGIALLTWEECEGRTLSTLGLAAAVGRRLFSLFALVLIVGVGLAVACALLSLFPLTVYTGTFVEGYLFMLPGLLFAAYIAFAIPAATIEKLGPLRALKRSFRLTRGRIIKILGIFLVFFVSSNLLALLMLPLFLLSPRLMAVSFLLNVLFACILLSFMLILLTLLYRNARIEKDGAQPAG
jgi:hypothetical protein